MRKFEMVAAIVLAVGGLFILVQRFTRRPGQVFGMSRAFAMGTIAASLVAIAAWVVMVSIGPQPDRPPVVALIAATAFATAGVSAGVVPALLVIELIILFQLVALPAYRQLKLRAVHAAALASCCAWVGTVVCWR